MELLEVKNTIIIMRNSLDGSNRLLDTIKGKISESEDITNETKQNKTQKEKMTGKIEQSISELWGKFKQPKILMKSLKKKRGQRTWSDRKSHSLLVGIQNGTTLLWKTT